MSGEDQRHTHADVEGEVAEQVASRVVLPDGRIVEQTDHDPATNPPNVVRGNNAGL
jgi:ABC-type arginine transport system ATPase subunit